MGREDSLDAAYTKLGFGDVKYRYYDVDVGKAGDFVGWSTARKTITLNGKRTTIVALILRGGGYGGEWTSNLHTGTTNAHYGPGQQGAVRTGTGECLRLHLCDASGPRPAGLSRLAAGLR